MKPCLFCRIAVGEVPSYTVYESADVRAFLDIHPIRLGHLQVVSKEHFPYFDDLPPHVGAEILRVGQRLAPALRRVFGVERVAFLFTGGDIAHAHAHVVPMVEATDITSRRYIVQSELTFQNAPPASAADLQSAADAIRLALGHAT
jgi:histidine triad (HIT) family protein